MDKIWTDGQTSGQKEKTDGNVATMCPPAPPILLGTIKKVHWCMTCTMM